LVSMAGLRGNKMSGAYSTNRDTRKAYKISVG